MALINNLPWDWIVFVGLVLSLMYAMRVIRKESASVVEEMTPQPWQGLILSIPRWWTQTRSDEHQLQFERTDTRYDWYARFTWIPGGAEFELHELMNQKVEADELDYDADDVTLVTDGRVLFRDSAIQERFKEVIRVEGKASQRIEERLYLDMCLMRDSNKQGYFLFESRSSVLNGLVEGPFFEEVLAELTLQ